MWIEQTDAPGPGNYSDQTKTIGKAVLGGHMGAKIEEKISSNPGPGQYDADASKIR